MECNIKFSFFIFVFFFKNIGEQILMNIAKLIQGKWTERPTESG